MEEWKPIPSFQDYEVSSFGNIKSKRFPGRFLKPAKDKDGYLYVCCNRKIVKIHRAVAIAFIPNIENKPTIDHINRIKSDNRVENLRWATRLEQIENRKDIKNKSGEKYIRKNHSAWYCYIDQSNHIRFETLEEAIRYRDTVLAQSTTRESSGNDTHTESQ